MTPDMLLLKPRKSQVSLEYLLLIAGALVLIVILLFLFKGNLFGPAESDIANRSGEIKGVISSLQPTEGGAGADGEADADKGTDGLPTPKQPFT